VLLLRFYEPSHIATRGRDREGDTPSRQRRFGTTSGKRPIPGTSWVQHTLIGAGKT